MEIKKQISMPRQSVSERIYNFDEVALGYNEDMALAEASRCLTCKNPKCVSKCPVGVNIPDFINSIKNKQYLEAVKIIKQTNSLPAICGRVCPHEKQCQSACIFAKQGEPIAIGRLERFVADYEAEQSKTTFPEIKDSSLKKYKIAVVGSGPSGLTVASSLATMGYGVTVFEALHKTGGVLRYGIPEFRLPRNVLDREIEYIKKLGVAIIPNAVIGKAISVVELFDEGFSAVYISTGSGAPKLLDIPGENLSGIFSGNEWLTRINLMLAYRESHATPFPQTKHVVVIGAGNTAMDCARSAVRIGAEKVDIIYRRSRDEMPARAEEVINAEDEGVRFNFLMNPSEFVGDENGCIDFVKCQKMQLGEPDASGRRRPIPIPGEFIDISADTVVVALGQNPNPLIRNTTNGLEVRDWGGVVIDSETGMTSIEGVFAGGDVVSGEATVISAMGAGRIAAKGIDRFIRNKFGIE